ncbi:gmc oxidoreductase [Colletotrichum incanum]|uniref:Gmc oxidoreductase n=1 Tax=Colletotrichum incanum TaxID=1573173 RepID=A0A166M3W6_COLIC|nr:gmc oxidoreductase [Colletotrichum incanum]OHW92145.1 GMC oxidoreductase [Colletotrichum incanum]
MAESIIVKRSLDGTAGAYRTPQFLMLSEIVPVDILAKHDSEVKLEQPEVDQNMHSRIVMLTAWKVENPSAGWAYERVHIAAAFARNKDVKPGPDHPLLRQDRAHVLPSLQCNCAWTDISSILMFFTVLVNSSRGSLGTYSANASNPIMIESNYFSTAADRYGA